MKPFAAVFAALIGLPLLAADPAKPDAKDAKPAKVVVTAEVACLHCHFGIGDGCAPALRLDDKTALLVEGKATATLAPVTFKKRGAVVEGTLSIKDKQLLLAAETAKLLDEKEARPAKALAVIEGTPICGRCDLSLCEECTLAVKNGKTPIILDGSKALDHAEDLKWIGVTGHVKIDGRGLLRIDANKVDKKK
jgi:hypothetical protein